MPKMAGGNGQPCARGLSGYLVHLVRAPAVGPFLIAIQSSELEATLDLDCGGELGNLFASSSGSN